MPCIHLVVGASIIHLQYSTCIPKLSICYTVVMYGVSNACSLKVTCIQYYLLFDDSEAVNFERYELEINIMSMTHAIWIILLFQRLLQFFFIIYLVDYYMQGIFHKHLNFMFSLYIPILSVAEFKMCLT